ncbi:MAG: YaaR family protein [Spirochaetes bacterium]|nr:YaaR family protein [Spirochaetota bacterium]
MAKVELPDNLVAGLIPGLFGRKPADGKKVAKGKGAFRTTFRDAERAEIEARSLGSEPFVETELGDMLDGVYGAGDDLKRNPTADNILAYKRSVRNFVHFVVERAYRLEERSSSRDILKRKKFSSLSVIDEKLERLAAEVISTQRNQLEILRRVDEINGLLVDLTT